jgi:hypothetical protein
MKQFLITFITLDGRENSVYMDARTEKKALYFFKSEYQYKSILSCVDITDNIEKVNIDDYFDYNDMEDGCYFDSKDC